MDDGAPDNDIPKKQRRVTQLQPFHADLEAGIIALKNAIMRESFKVKGKFPPALKPKLQQLALQAILLDMATSLATVWPPILPASPSSISRPCTVSAIKKKQETERTRFDHMVDLDPTTLSCAVHQAHQRLLEKW